MLEVKAVCKKKKIKLAAISTSREGEQYRTILLLEGKLKASKKPNSLSQYCTSTVLIYYIYTSDFIFSSYKWTALETNLTKLYPSIEVMTLSYLSVFISKEQNVKIINHLEIYLSLTQLARFIFFLMIILNMF